MRRFVIRATANSDWAAVNSSSRRCEPAIGSPCRLRDEIANTSGSDPTSRVHWLTLELTRAPRAAFVCSRHANRPAMMNSGASDASGASHCTRKNSEMP